MCQEPTELLLIGCSTESTRNPKIQIKHVDTKNQLADVLDQRKFLKRWMESLLCLFSIQGEPHERNPCAPLFGGTTTWGNLTTSKLCQRRFWREKFTSSKPKIKLRFWFSCEGATRHRRSYVCCWFGSFNAQCWVRETWAQTQWMLWEGPKTPWATYRDRGSANKWGSTSFCSWSRSVRNSAIPRWNASNSIASSALLKTRIFM